MKRVEREKFVNVNRCIALQGLHQNTELGFFTSCQNIHQQSSGCGTKQCIDTKSLSKEAMEDQSDISFTNTREIKMNTVNNDRGTDKDELPPFTFVSVSAVLVKSEDLDDQESESCVTDPLLKDPLEIHPNDSNASKVRNVIKDRSQVKIEIKQETEVPALDFKITENDSTLKEIKNVSYLDVVPLGNEIKHSCDELATNGEGNMFLATKHMGDVQSNQKVTHYRAMSSFCSEDCKSQDLQVKFESICEPDLKEEKPCLTELDVENTEDDDEPFSLKQGNEESSIVSMQNVNRELGVTTTRELKIKNSLMIFPRIQLPHQVEDGVDKSAFSRTFGSPMVQKVSSELGRELKKYSGNEEPFNSSLCDPVFSSKVKCKPILSHLADEVHFGSGNTHEKHDGHLHSEKSFSCHVCCAVFRYQYDLEFHMRIHIGEKPFKCGECQASFCDSSTLRRHERTHTGEKPFKCAICDVSCTFKWNLKDHMRIHTGEEPFKCGECKASFRQLNNLRRHERIHTGEKPFKCGECQASFVESSKLRRHEQTHTVEKLFKCAICGVSCTNKSSLNEHMRIHSGEKPFNCKICGFSCTQKGNLNSHMRIHTGERPFKCGECKASFRQSNKLRRHELIHTGEKPFKCGECQASFIESSSLRIHQRTHTGEKPFKCGECKSTFSRKDNMKLHMQMHSFSKKR